MPARRCRHPAGQQQPRLRALLLQGLDRWVFNQYTADTTAATPSVRCKPPAGVTARHSGCIWRAPTAPQPTCSSLYVNGTLAGRRPTRTAWDARRGLQIGAGSYNGAPAASSRAPSTTSAVRQAVASGEVTKLRNHQAVGARDGPPRGLPPRRARRSDRDHRPRRRPAAVYKGGGPPACPASPERPRARRSDRSREDRPEQLRHINNQQLLGSRPGRNSPTKPDHAAIIAAQAGRHDPASSCTTPPPTAGRSTSTPPTARRRYRCGRREPTEGHAAGVWMHLAGRPRLRDQHADPVRERRLRRHDQPLRAVLRRAVDSRSGRARTPTARSAAILPRHDRRRTGSRPAALGPRGRGSSTGPPAGRGPLEAGRGLHRHPGHRPDAAAENQRADPGRRREDRVRLGRQRRPGTGRCRRLRGHRHVPRRHEHQLHGDGLGPVRRRTDRQRGRTERTGHLQQRLRGPARADGRGPGGCRALADLDA